jgi:hypothetical protein
MSSHVLFLRREDTEELVKALQEEGYTVSVRENPDPGSTGRWVVEVDPADDEVAALVDVYGGWLPDEAG